MILSITGITGNMGQATLDALKSVQGIDELRLLAHNEKRIKKLLKKHKDMLSRIKVIHGGMASREAVSEIVNGADLIINMAAVIPPRADNNPKAAVACNQTGAFYLVEEIEKQAVQPALVHVSTVAVYGNRSGAHRFGRVSDPLCATPLDAYSTTKMRAEKRVMDSDIQKWAILRQSAMLHPQMLSDNIHDGLMFHTVYDAPLEWITANDSGRLIANIVRKFIGDERPDGFWRRCFNIAGGADCRRYGLHTFDEGFVIVGGSTKDFFKPYYNATRNFHGIWYADGDELNDMFDFRRETPESYWKLIFKTHPVFKLGRLVPKRVIGHFVVGRLLKSKNAPAYWAKHNDTARIQAYFGGYENYEKLKTAEWKDYPTIADLKKITQNESPIEYGFDVNKPDCKITEQDLINVATARGGKLLSKYDGDMYKTLEWQNADGVIFTAKPYTVLRGGHWHCRAYDEFVWDYDKQAKTDKVLASVWYDSHDPSENYVYSFDDEFNTHLE